MSDTTLQGFFGTVGKALGDVAELQVLTFSGTANAYISAGTDKPGIDWSKVFTDAAKLDAKLILVAATQIKIDGDTILFISSAPEATETLKQAHADATVAAQKYRSELVLGAINLIGYKP